MIWAKIVAMVLGLIEQFVKAKHDNTIKQQAADEVIAAVEKKVAQDVSVAENSRADVQREYAANASSLRDDDGFRRD